MIFDQGIFPPWMEQWTIKMGRQAKGKDIFFILFVVVSMAIFAAPLRSLFKFAWESDTFSYILLIPVVGAYFFYEYRKEIFARKDGWHFAGAVPIALAIPMFAIGTGQADRLGLPNYLALMTLSCLFLLVGGLGIFYGVAAWKAARFPIFFLLFTAPIPEVLLDKIVVFLQDWSAEVANVFFGVTGVPIYRDGFIFNLPGLTIEVAKECSGIRSSISLFLVSLLAGHLMLRQTWRKAVLTLSIVPIAIVKNAVRIVTLSLLAVYVDPRILGSVAHQRGGIPIFFLALVLLGCVLVLLRRKDKKERER